MNRPATYDSRFTAHVMLPRFSIFVLLFILLSHTSHAEDSFNDFFSKGRVAFAESDYENSNLNFQSAISAFTENDDSTKLGECYLYIGTVYGKLDNLTKSEEYSLFANNIFKNCHNDTLLIRSYNVLGNISVLKKNVERALKYYENGLDLAEKHRMFYVQCSILNNMGVLQYNQYNYNEAIKYYRRSLDICDKIKNENGTGLALINIGISYEGLKNHDKAISYIEKGLEKAKALNDAYVLQNAYEQLSIIYYDASDFKKAYDNLNLFTIVKDSIASADINKQIAELETKYSTQRKELEILALKNEKQKSKIEGLEAEGKIKSLKQVILIILVVLSLIILLSVLFFNQYKKKLALSTKLNFSKAELEKKNIELLNSLDLNTKLQNALKQDLDNYKQLAYRKQMNPHFIFNSLNSIQNYILTNDKLKANYYLGELSTLIRRVLENSEKEFVTLKEELFVCETYVKLEEKRFEGKFDYDFSWDEDLDLTSILIPPLLLQPFIENAIWHGLLHKSDDALLTINVTSSEENVITITIADNGVGRSSNKKHINDIKLESMGINLTLDRINLNNFVSDDSISLKINDLVDPENNPAGTEVVIDLHINSK